MESDRIHAAGAIMREAVDYDDAPGRRAGLAELAARARHPRHQRRRHARARPPHPLRGRDARRDLRRRRCREQGGARARSTPSRAWSAATSPARSPIARARRSTTATAAARGSSRSTPASSARSSATSPRAARRSRSSRAPRTAEELLARDPDGFFLVPGPGDPAALDYIVETHPHAADDQAGVRHLPRPPAALARRRAWRPSSCPFGHRGANHPVKDLRTGRIAITSPEPRLRGRAATPGEVIESELGAAAAHPREPLRRHDRGDPPARRPRRLRPVPPRGGPRPERLASASSTSSSSCSRGPCRVATTSTRSSCSARARS